MRIFRDEKGFSTLTVVVSLLLTLSLIFSAAQVYRVSSASADIQNVADSATLASENNVAEFMILVKISDAIILSLGIGSVVSTGLGVISMCTPVTAGMSSTFIEAAKKMLDARNEFANNAFNSLNTLQKSLPFLGSVSAFQVAKANNGGTFDANYLAVSIMFPKDGKEISPGNSDDIKDLLNDVDNNSEELKQAAYEAEEQAKKANEAKYRAFMADCGNNPNYCMYERAYNKANMHDSSNPLFKSVDTWSFKAALTRSQSYYPKRYLNDKPEGSSINAQANSNLRKVFYAYASKQLETGYVNEDDDYYEAYFPHLPRNTEEMKQTEMYTDDLFPYSGNCMHAYPGCPNCSHIDGYGSIAKMEGENFSTCEVCKFKASSLGQVASASTSINNGYEYHYAVVEQASKDYQEAKQAAVPLNSKVKNIASGFLEKIKELIKDISNKRIYAKPPGSYGNISFIVNTNSAPANKGFESSFVSNDNKLGIRFALSASTLLEEDSNQGKNVVTKLLRDMTNRIPGIAGAAGIVLGAWTKLLDLYCNGQTALISSVENSINQILLSSASGLGTWAGKLMTSLFKDLGLEPANLKPLKPVLVNSYYVANAASIEGMSFATKYINIKNSALSLDNKIVDSIANSQELISLLNLQELGNINGEIEIATFKPLGDFGPEIPFTITLPKFTNSFMGSIIQELSMTIQKATDFVWGGKVWR